MTMHLEQLRDDVRNTLGIYLAESTIDDQAIDAALRHALRFGAQYAPMVNQQITLLADGKVQAIGALATDIARIMDVRYPYDPDFPNNPTYPFVLFDHGVVHLKYGNPAAGQHMLISGRPLYTLEGINGAADTLPASLDEPYATLAAAQLLRIEYFRRAATTPPTTDKAAAKAPTLNAVAIELEQYAIEMFYANTPVKQNPVWGNGWDAGWRGMDKDT